MRPARTNGDGDIVKALEDVGVLVMMSGIVGNNTHRPLSTDEFRGFSLYDVLAPLIFVNLAGESYGAQNFTLVHEFSHLLAGHSALSGGDHLLGGTSEEAWCNRVAAIALLPDDALAAFDAAQSVQDYRVAARRLVYQLKSRSIGCTARAGLMRNVTVRF